MTRGKGDKEEATVNRGTVTSLCFIIILITQGICVRHNCKTAQSGIEGIKQTIATDLITTSREKVRRLEECQEKCCRRLCVIYLTRLHSHNCKCPWHYWSRGCRGLRGQEDGYRGGGQLTEINWTETPQGVRQPHRCAALTPHVTPKQPSFGPKMSCGRSRQAISRYNFYASLTF